jgi:uncharacterized damage-inducible protein DinB
MQKGFIVEKFRAHIATITAFPARLTALVTPLTDAQLHFRPDEKEWSVLENIGHLIEIDPLYVNRIDRILSEERPVFAPFDPDAGVRAADYQHQNVSDLLATYVAQRQATIDGLSTIELDELTRVGIHAKFGEVSVARLVELLAGHDEIHYTQITNTIPR